MTGRPMTMPLWRGRRKPPMWFYTFFACICTSVFAVMVMAVVMTVPVHAQSDAVPGQTAGQGSCPHAAYYIAGVEVAASDADATAARAKATADGLAGAWQFLKGRLLLPDQVFDDGDVVPQALLDYRSVVSETVLARNYIGVFDYCFDRRAVRAVFAAKGVRHAELVSAPILVMPIRDGASGAQMRGAPGHWLAAWEELLEGRYGLTELRLPRRLATDRYISPAALVAGDAAQIAEAARLESADKVLVAVARVETGGLWESNTLTAGAALYDREGRPEARFSDSPPLALSTANTGDIFAGLADDIAGQLEARWRVINALAAPGGAGEGGAGSILLTIPAQDLATWRGHLDVLRQLPVVRDLRVVHISAEGGVVRLDLSSSVYSLVNALEPRGLAIEAGRHADGGIILELHKRGGGG